MAMTLLLLVLAACLSAWFGKHCGLAIAQHEMVQHEDRQGVSAALSALDAGRRELIEDVLDDYPVGTSRIATAMALREMADALADSDDVPMMVKLHRMTAQSGSQLWMCVSRQDHASAFGATPAGAFDLWVSMRANDAREMAEQAVAAANKAAVA